MLLNKNSLSNNKKICNIRKEMIINKIRFFTQKSMSEVIYYDQMEELNATLNKLKLKESIICNDLLEDWCKDHPNDLECRVYE